MKNKPIFFTVSDIEDRIDELADSSEDDLEDDLTPILEEIPQEHLPLMEDLPVMNPTKLDDEVFENEHSPYIEISQPLISHQEVSNFAAQDVS